MDKLPTEILNHIFRNTSQRNLFQCSIVCKKWNNVILQPSFYFTIELYSYHQLKKYIKTATKKRINIGRDDEKPMIYYTQHLNIYFDMLIFYEAILDFISDFPNLLTINALGNDISGSKCIVKTIPQLKHLISIPFWYKAINKEYIMNSSQQKNKLVSLCHTIQHNDNNDECIYLNPVGPVNPGKEGLSYFLFDINDDVDESLRPPYQCKILILPTFESLTRLKVSFMNFQSESSINEYDERLMESIHSSCPQLEKLQLNDFYMNISSEFDPRIISNSNRSFVSSGLKEFKVEGVLRHPKCFIYLSLKYPQLKSFTLKSNDIDFLSDDLKMYQLPVYDMITHYFTSLKQLNIYFATGCHPGDNFYDGSFWPKHNFIQWLNNHPDQLTHLAYPDSLFPVEWNNEDSDSSDDEWLEKSWKNLNDSTTTMQITVKDMNLHSMHSFYKNKILHSGTFFNYLTSLSLRFKHMVDTAITFLLLHDQHTMVVSNSIKELKIYSSTARDYFYFYDWLDLFPNLTTFYVKRVNFLIFDTEDDKYISFDDGNEENGNYLHYLMKQRKSLLNERNDCDNNNNNNGCYKLKKLILESVCFRLKNGFNAIFKKIPYLNHLTLKWIYYSPPEWNSIESDSLPITKNIYINLSNSYLDVFSISQFRIAPWVDPYSDKFIIVNKLTVNESLPQKEYTVDLKNASNKLFWSPLDDYQYTLHLVSKYVDRLIY